MSIQLTLTDAGIQALINSQKNGTNALVLSSVKFGTGKYKAEPSQTDMQNPFKTLNTISGGAVGDNIIHIGIRDTDVEAYTVYEIGVYTNEGILFAVYSQDTPLIQKAENSYVMVVLDFPVLAAGMDDIVVEGTGGFWNPPATTETPGVIEIATDKEIEEGTDVIRAVTSKQLSKVTAQIREQINTLMNPSPEEVFRNAYGQSSGDVIGSIKVQIDPIEPDPVDTFEEVLSSSN